MNSLIKASLILTILFLMLWGGLAVVPSWNASRDMIATSGTQIQIHNNLSFIPFTLSDSSFVHGSLAANQNIGVYIINSTNANLSPYSPPNKYVYFSGLSNTISFNLSMGRGSYYLVFFGTNPGYSAEGATVRVTQSVSFHPIVN